MGWIYNGEELLKANKAQQDAVGAYQTQEYVKTFIGNPNVPVVIGGGALIYFAVQFSESVLDWIRVLIPDLRDMADAEWEKVKKDVKTMVNPLNYLTSVDEYNKLKEDILADMTPEERAQVEEGIAEVEQARNPIRNFVKSIIPGI